MEGFCPGGSFLHVILRLHFEEHLPQVVIGRRLGVTKSTVCSMFVRFRSICRTYRKYRYARSPRGKKRPRRPNFPYKFKIALVEQSLQPRTCVAQIARENGINDNLLFNCVSVNRLPYVAIRQELVTLRAQIEKLRRMLFGTRSEKLRREVELAEALLKQREQDSDRYSGREDDPQVPRQLRQSRHRRPLPAHLPREIHRLEPEESCCPECGGELDYLGEVSAEQLELVSSALKVIRTERVKKACTKCDCIVEAPAPSRPIERGIAGPGLLARVLTGKYCEHLPLYRQSEIFARQGVELSRALLSNWVDACCQLMTPVSDALCVLP